jgi:hypothetical protein
MNNFKLLKFLIIFLVATSCTENTSKIVKDPVDCCENGYTDADIGKLQRKIYLLEANLEICEKENASLNEENQIFSSMLGELETNSECSRILQELYDKTTTVIKNKWQ